MFDAPLELQFAEAAKRACTLADVEMGYQVFLGRDPENSVVVEEAMTTWVSDFIVGLVTSDEFQENTLDCLGNERPLQREIDSLAPSAAQKDWLLGHLHLPPQSVSLLRDENDWPEWLSIFVALPGFPIAPQVGPMPFKPLQKKRATQTGKHRAP